MADETIISMKAMLAEHSETIRNLKSVLSEREKELRDCVNELCMKCGNCSRQHLGACDGCRWAAIRARCYGRM